MSSTLLYELTLFGHILGGFGLIAAISLESVSLRGLRQAATAEAARFSLRPMRLVPPLGAGSGLLILITGIYMMVTSWRLQGWIATAVAGLVLNALIGALITGNRMRRVGHALAGNGALSTEARTTLHDPVLLASLRLRLGVLIGILFLMTVKPSAVASVAVIVVAAAIGLATALINPRRSVGELGLENR